jgi:hypothetical protein
MHATELLIPDPSPHEVENAVINVQVIITSQHN